jgi:cytochrome P450
MTTIPPIRTSFKGPFPPGPRSWIPGTALRAMQRDPLNFLTRAARENGDVVHFTFGPQHLYLVNEPELIREVLVTQGRSFMKGRALQRTKMVLGEGLLTSEDPLHKRQRRLAQPAFHRERIARYAEVMVERAKKTSDAWSDGATIDAAAEMMRLTLAVVAQTLFAADVDASANEISAAMSRLMDVFPMLVSPFTDILRHLPLPAVRRADRAIAQLDAIIYRIINERRASGEDRGDLLSMLLLAQDEEGSGGMTDLQLRDEAMTLFLAGHETTANALAWTWYLLAQHPDIEAELHREVDALGGDPTPADYPRLKFTEMVFAESMRIFPPAWIIGRLALEDVRLGGWTIPRGAVVIVSQWVTHRDARWWPEPERFDPRRFAEASHPKFAYFPFGGGSRVCIGEGFAWMEGVLVLATIARKWRLLLASDEPVQPQPVITLRPRGGIAMTLTAR